MPRRPDLLVCKMASLATVIIATAVVLLYITSSSPAAAKKGPKVTDIVSRAVDPSSIL